MVVNRAESVSTPTIQDWIDSYFFNAQYGKTLPKNEDFYLRSGIIHRLDKDTSGVLAIAKTKPAFDDLQKQFKERTVHKTYIALLHSHVRPLQGAINIPVGRGYSDRKRFTAQLSGKTALTEYSVYSQLKREKKHEKQYFSLVYAYPKTGRTHQLRVHFKHIHAPIVSDPWYLSKKQYAIDLEWCPRLFLHAFSLHFTHRLTGKKMSISVPLAKDLKIALEQLQRYS